MAREWANFTEEEKIQAARMSLLVEHPFLAVLLMHMDIAVKKNLDAPMATDGRRIISNLGNLEKAGLRYGESDVRYMVAHEAMHVALMHLFRRGERDFLLWNIAADIATNNLLNDFGGASLRCSIGLQVQEYKDMSAEEIYEILKEKGGGMRASAKGAGTPGEENESGNACEAYGLPGDVKSWGEGYGDSHKAWEELARELSKPGGDKKVEALARDWKERIVQAAQSAKMQGKLPGALERYVDEIANPKLDWRDVLRRFVVGAARNDYRFPPFNRRLISQGLYFPALRSDSVEVAVAIDTSGSIGPRELAQFYGELFGMLAMRTDYTVHLIGCDAAVHSYERIRRGNTPSLELGGGGGTDFRPVFDYIEEEEIKPNVLVYLTDGYGTWPEDAPRYPTLWVMTTDIVAPFGETIRLED